MNYLIEIAISIWATSKLKEYLIQEYAINRELLQEKSGKIKELELQID